MPTSPAIELTPASLPEKPAPSAFSLALLWLRSRVLRDRAARWNHQYVTGRWARLASPAEQARLDATAQLLTRHAHGGRVLEIGCGEALLLRHVDPVAYHSWLGVDISAVAIERARVFASQRVRYLVGDMETFNPGVRFDAIVFPESIYYSGDPARLLQRYAQFLEPDGCFVISIFRTKRSLAIQDAIHRVVTVVDAVTTTNELGTWDCEVLQPLATYR